MDAVIQFQSQNKKARAVIKKRSIC